MTPVEPVPSPHHVRAAAPALASHVVAVASGKGGVGKSSISVNLGMVLSRMGRRVCILDADTGLANINILLGITPVLSLEHVLFGAKTIDEVILSAPHDLKIIPGANGISECVDLQERQQLHLTRQLSQIEQDFDYLIVDTAAGISETTLNFVRAAQHTLLVLTPEPTSLTDAFSLVKLLVRRNKKQHFQVVVNLCRSAGQARGVYQRFAMAVEKYIGVKLSYLGYLLQDESLRAAVTMQSPVALFPEADPSCRSFFRLAQSLEAALVDITPIASFSAYWQSLYRQRHGTESPRRMSPAPSGKGDEGQKYQQYLTELRTRLLTLMAHGRLPAEEFQALLRDLQDGLQTHYSAPDASALPTVTEEKAVIVDNKTVQANAVAQPSAGSVADNQPAVQAPVQPHQYDVERFGDQRQLLEKLRASPGQELSTFFDSVMSRTGGNC